MKFPDNPKLEAMIGRVCLVFAQVEQTAGHTVASAHGKWDAAGSMDYLDFSSGSGLLLDWLKTVAAAYPEVADDTTALRDDLRTLKSQRDQWAHSSGMVDLFLLMRERGATSMSNRDLGGGKLLNGKKPGHVVPPSTTDVEDFCARASKTADAAEELAFRLAKLADAGLRRIDPPRNAITRSSDASAWPARPDL